MDFNFSEEQQLLADSVQRFVREHYTFEARREILKSAPGWSREVWKEIAGLGLTAINVPEAHGGLNGGPVETMLVMNSFGEGLLLEPFLSAAVIAPRLVLELQDSAAAAELLPAIAAGERIHIVAHQERQSRGGDLAQVTTRAQKSGDGYVLNGHKSVVAHGGTADEFLVTARTSGSDGDAAGISVFRVDAKAAGLTVTSYGTIDGQNAADLQLNDVKATLIGTEGKAFPAVESAYEVAIAGLCAEAVGIMKAVNAATLDYTRNRKQFGQPIAKFQVLQHRMADMFVQSEQAKSMSYLAAIKCTDPNPIERRRTLSAAKVVIGQAGRYVAQQAVQLHGGMGMTDELMVSHHFKRLTTIDLTLGDADFHLQRFAALAEAG